MGNTLQSHLNFVIVEQKSDAQRLLNKAEQVDFYVEECNDDAANFKARQDLNYSANTVSANIAFFKNALEAAKVQLPKRLLSDLGTIYLVQLMPSADGGMPHTRPGSIICYASETILYQTSTLIHELWHIHQRTFKKMWTDVFHRMEWSEWVDELPASLASNRRYNPDTIDSPIWIFRKRWVPIPIFKDPSQPKIQDVDIWFYDVILQYHIKNVPAEMMIAYPNLPASAYEHPRELTAYMLAEPKKYQDIPAFKELILLIGGTSIKT